MQNNTTDNIVKAKCFSFHGVLPNIEEMRGIQQIRIMIDTLTKVICTFSKNQFAPVANPND